jgi:C4-dicarboxylate-specific signal transduction histidine kinase
MNTFDGENIETLLMTAWLGAVASRDHAVDAIGEAVISRPSPANRLRLERARATRGTRLGLLAASIAHEIKQPLAAIRLNGETGLRWLEGNSPNVVRARTLIERIVRDAGRALDIVHTIAVGHAAEQTELTLDEIVSDAIAFLQHELHSNNVTISHHSTPSAVRITGNRLQLQQLFINLIINSVQALASSVVESRKIKIDIEKIANDLVRCTVEDNGPGLDPSHLSSLFKNAFTTKPAGMGIGLFICKSIVAAHGGNIRADNASSLGGARFAFTLHAIADAEN